MSATLTLPVASTIRFHLSLNVADLGKAVAFYRILFGTEPAKRRDDYAKFELDDPSLVLSLEPHAPNPGGALNHLGFRLPDAETLVAMQRRLEMAGIRSQREEGVECCYARQTKFWVTDIDNNLWEFYTLEGDLDHRGVGQSREQMTPTAPVPAPATDATSWEHRLNEPLPESIPLADGSVREVRLRGTLNLPLDAAVQQRLLDEVVRVLKPGGRLFVHVLVADRVLEKSPTLPGPAAMVRHVPHEREPMTLLEAAGFHGVRLLKFDAKPCFERDGAALREMQLEGWKREETGKRATAIYKGPLRAVTDDAGTTYPRGERVTIDADAAERLRRDDAAGHFLLLDA